jgi:hypothetical protein
LVKHPSPEDGIALYSQADPPSCCRAAELIALLVNTHLRALKLTAASFPKHWHPVAHKLDLEKELLKTIAAGWPNLAVQLTPRVRSRDAMPGKPPRTPEFTNILGGWAVSIRKALAQHEQTKERADAA